MGRKFPLQRSGKRCLATIRQDVSLSSVALDARKVTIVNGKPLVTVTHARDFTDSDGDGKPVVSGTMTLRAGTYILPRMYVHPSRIIVNGEGYPVVGTTCDARFIPEMGWIVLLDAVLRTRDGKPVLKHGCRIEMSGWFLESALKDAGQGFKAIRLGKTAPNRGDIGQFRADRIRKARAMERGEDLS